MKLNEFKAWFEGYTEGMEGAPSKKQWERIKEQVSAIDGVPVSYPVYIDRYVRPYWGDRYYAYAQGLSADARDNGNGNLLAYATNSADKEFDGVTAMYAAGKAESLSN